MYKITKTYTDYRGTERTEDFYFNLNEAEITEMQLGITGGLAEMIERIVASQDAPSLISTFKDVVLRAYGEPSADGRRFIKNDKLREEFTQTEAYSMIFMELAFDAEKASKFINGIVPASMSKQMQNVALPQN